MLVRSSFRDMMSKVKKEFPLKDRIDLIKYHSIDNLLFTNDYQSSSNSQIDLSNRRLILTRQHSRCMG